MATTTKNATLKYWPGGVSGQCRQGFYNGSGYSGHMIFNFSSEIPDWSNVDITKIVLTMTIGSLGGAYTKRIYLKYAGTDKTVGEYDWKQCRNITKSLTWESGTNFNKLKSYMEGLGAGTSVYLGLKSPSKSRDSSYSGSSYDWDYLNVTSATLALTYNFKKSTGSITAPATPVTGSNTTFKINAGSSNYTHKVTWKLGSFSESQNITAGTTQTQYSIPHRWLPSATSGTVTVTLETLSNGASLGTNTYTFTVKVPDSIRPSIATNGWKLTPVQTTTGATTVGGTSIYIQGYSKVNAYLDSSVSNYVKAGDGATGLTKYELTTSPNYGSFSATSWSAGSNNGWTSNLFTAAGTVTLVLKITDSRGRTNDTSLAVAKKEITVQAYSAPKVTGTTFYRVNSSGTSDEAGGTFLKAKISYSCTTFTSPATQNTIGTTASDRSITVKSGSTTVIAATALPNTGTETGTLGTNSGGVGPLSTETAYTATIALKDKMGVSSSYDFAIPSAAYIIHIRKGGKSIGIGMASSTTNNRLDIKWPTYIGGNTSITGSLTTTGNETVGGSLTSNNNITALGTVYIKRTAIDGTAADNGLTSNQYPSYICVDKNGNAFAYCRGVADTSGNMCVDLGVKNYVNSAWTEKLAFRCRYRKDNVVEYSVADKTAFQNAIGLKPTSNAAWKDAPVGLTHYRYESTTAASDYDLPHNYVHVLVLKYSSTRGVAQAWRWSNSGSNAKNTGCQWMNILHGSTWAGWVQTSYTFAGADTAIGEWTDGKTLYRYCCNGSTASTGDVTTSSTLPRTPDNIISIRGAFQRDSAEWRPITFHSYAVAQHAVSVCITTDNKIHLYIGSSMTGTKKWNLIVEYTA